MCTDFKLNFPRPNVGAPQALEAEPICLARPKIIVESGRALCYIRSTLNSSVSFFGNLFISPDAAGSLVLGRIMAPWRMFARHSFQYSLRFPRFMIFGSKNDVSVSSALLKRAEHLNR
jgi:hypothetical protein